MKNKVLFLDFDGVLFDTLKEVYLINRYICSHIGIFEAIDSKYELFSKYKYLVYNIWMFYYYNPIIFSDTKEDEIVGKFLSCLNNRDMQKEKIFCEDFLDARKDLIFNHFDFWKNLETPYDFFFEIKKLYDTVHPEIVIVSKKNKSSIIDRFKTYDFNLDEKNIFAREILDQYSSKGEFLDQYMNENNFESAIFVDDNSNNLKSTKNNPKINNILALWGNCEPQSNGLGQKEAIEVIEDFFN